MMMMVMAMVMETPPNKPSTHTNAPQYLLPSMSNGAWLSSSLEDAKRTGRRDQEGNNRVEAALDHDAQVLKGDEQEEEEGEEEEEKEEGVHRSWRRNSDDTRDRRSQSIRVQGARRSSAGFRRASAPAARVPTHTKGVETMYYDGERLAEEVRQLRVECRELLAERNQWARRLKDLSREIDQKQRDVQDDLRPKADLDVSVGCSTLLRSHPILINNLRRSVRDTRTKLAKMDESITTLKKDPKYIRATELSLEVRIGKEEVGRLEGLVTSGIPSVVSEFDGQLERQLNDQRSENCTLVEEVGKLREELHAWREVIQEVTEELEREREQEGAKALHLIRPSRRTGHGLVNLNEMDDGTQKRNERMDNESQRFRRLYDDP